MIQVVYLLVEYLLVKLWDIPLSSIFDDSKDKKQARYS